MKNNENTMNTQPLIITPTRLYLIRHGETAWSLSGQHTGRTDLRLTTHGEDQVRELAPRLEEIAFAHVLTSPLLRARQTCELAGLAGCAKIEPDLVEWDYGDYEGQRPADVRAERADWNIYQDGCPHGETPAQITARADHVIAYLRTLGGNVALFSHGQFGRVLATRWIGLPLTEARHFLLDTASVSVLGYDQHQPQVSVIAQWNLASGATINPLPGARVGDARPMKQRALERWENEGGELIEPQGTLPATEK
jgi:probable phosphoglycerate mutase